MASTNKAKRNPDGINNSLHSNQSDTKGGSRLSYRTDGGSTRKRRKNNHRGVTGRAKKKQLIKHESNWAGIYSHVLTPIKSIVGWVI